MNFLIFGMKYLRVTQGYNTKVSHFEDGSFPLDFGGKSAGGHDAFYCPADYVIVKNVYLGTVNVVWYEAYNVWTPSGFYEKVCFSITHMNKEDIEELGLKVGARIDRGNIIGYEGTSGTNTAHIHFEISNKGYSGIGWYKTHKGKWRINNGVKVETMFYIDSSFTNVLDTKGLIFHELPKEESKYKKIIAIQIELAKYYSSSDRVGEAKEVRGLYYLNHPKYADKEVNGSLCITDIKGTPIGWIKKGE